MKFSALVNGKGHLTIPVSGIGDSWIVELPSPHYPAIAENEYAMMELARSIGIDVPEIRLLPVDEIAGLHEDVNDSRVPVLSPAYDLEVGAEHPKSGASWVISGSFRVRISVNSSSIGAFIGDG